MECQRARLVPCGAPQLQPGVATQLREVCHCPTANASCVWAGLGNLRGSCHPNIAVRSQTVLLFFSSSIYFNSNLCPLNSLQQPGAHISGTIKINSIGNLPLAHQKQNQFLSDKDFSNNGASFSCYIFLCLEHDTPLGGMYLGFH